MAKASLPMSQKQKHHAKSYTDAQIVEISGEILDVECDKIILNGETFKIEEIKSDMKKLKSRILILDGLIDEYKKELSKIK